MIQPAILVVVTGKANCHLIIFCHVKIGIIAYRKIQIEKNDL